MLILCIKPQTACARIGHTSKPHVVKTIKPDIRPAYTAHKFQRLPLIFLFSGNKITQLLCIGVPETSSRNFCSVCRPIHYMCFRNFPLMFVSETSFLIIEWHCIWEAKFLKHM